MLANVKPLNLTIQSIPTKTKSREKKKVLDCTKLEYYKEIFDFNNIEYHIIFLITQIPSQQCHAGDSLGTRVLFRTQFCETQVLKKW